MSKTTLEFNLPDEAFDLRMAQEGFKWHRVVSDLDDWLRNEIKHAANQPEAYEIRAKLYKIIGDWGLDINE